MIQIVGFLKWKTNGGKLIIETILKRNKSPTQLDNLSAYGLNITTQDSR